MTPEFKSSKGVEEELLSFLKENVNIANVRSVRQTGISIEIGSALFNIEQYEGREGFDVSIFSADNDEDDFDVYGASMDFFKDVETFANEIRWTKIRKDFTLNSLKERVEAIERKNK
ncbi:hypothetical protein Ab1vBOLIVR5_gp96c [Agrobacterium phage OLIVR5]|uniref:Uncharacterized protein n=1 Tax=Agrobacterium phage OLIVR5 TaxID=2723773 RepID=A0A858MSJ7_9CAUD|nr:hypothetical protein KNU99_gp096 [Agrobacterium phage OLIVR5]QIW87744.1 hypothetical protein Ab1vBOLIVR5_gp96c [Agrobacterium phage OLIVR5]QIW88006.1 hypothetical protein Ab1vBOLIVR6_gp99c [Agrobacterium phage OLIVR6]